MMSSFQMPQVQMPLPLHAPSAAMDAIGTSVMPWIEAHGLLTTPEMRQQLDRIRPEYTTALYFPHANALQLTHVHRYMVWAWLVDDNFDDAINDHEEKTVNTLSQALIEVSLGVRAPSNNLTRALADVLESLSRGRSTSWRALLGETNVSWLRTYMTEFQTIRQRQVMRFGDYLPHRRNSVGELMFQHLQEHVRDIELPAEARDLPAMTQARHRSSEWIGLYNDICSADKEDAAGYPYNAVLITRDRRACSIQEAAEAVNQVLAGLLAQFEAAYAAVPSQLRMIAADVQTVEETLQVLQGYRDLIPGNFSYHLGVQRYAQPAERTLSTLNAARPVRADIAEFPS